MARLTMIELEDRILNGKLEVTKSEAINLFYMFQGMVHFNKEKDILISVTVDCLNLEFEIRD